MKTGAYECLLMLFNACNKNWIWNSDCGHLDLGANARWSAESNESCGAGHIGRRHRQQDKAHHTRKGQCHKPKSTICLGIEIPIAPWLPYNRKLDKTPRKKWQDSDRPWEILSSSNCPWLGIWIALASKRSVHHWIEKERPKTFLVPGNLQSRGSVHWTIMEYP